MAPCINLEGFFRISPAMESADNENRERWAAGKTRIRQMKAFKRAEGGGATPQVARDKRCFPLNKETVKNTFVAEQVYACVCVCAHLLMHVYVQRECTSTQAVLPRRR